MCYGRERVSGADEVGDVVGVCGGGVEENGGVAAGTGAGGAGGRGGYAEEGAGGEVVEEVGALCVVQ